MDADNEASPPPFELAQPAVELRTVQASLVKSGLEVLSNLVDTVNWVFDEDGLKISSLDSAHVSYVSLELHASGLEGAPPAPCTHPTRASAGGSPRP